MKPTPEQIRAARKAAGMTQADAAKTVHATLRTWQMWEAGDRGINHSAWELFKIKTERKGMEIIGDFEVGQKLYVVDPCGITEYGAGIDVVPGTWQARVKRDPDGYVIRAEVSIEPADRFITMGKVIGVDSGQVGFFDEKTLIKTLDQERGKFNSVYDSDFYKACSKLTSGREQCGVLDGWAFLTATNGDGGLLLECGLDEKRRIIALAISLI